MRNILASKQKKANDQNIIYMLLPSLLSIILCMFFMAGTTWAYFMASIPPSTHPIQAANFDISVEMNATENSSSILPKENGTYSLEASKTYSVTLTAQGSAATGYCTIFLYMDGNTSSNKYYTDQIAHNESLTFVVKSDQNINCSFVPCWGTYAGTYDVSNGGYIRNISLYLKNSKRIL